MMKLQNTMTMPEAKRAAKLLKAYGYYGIEIVFECDTEMRFVRALNACGMRRIVNTLDEARELVNGQEVR